MPIVLVLSTLVAMAPFASRAPITSCAWVRAENDAAGSGFVVDVEKRLLVTCRHVVADRAKIDVVFPWFERGELITDRKRYLASRGLLRERGLLVTGTVLRKSDELDLALIELESLPPGVTAVAFATHAPQPGEPLRVIGNRLDLETVWNLSGGPLRVAGRLADGYFWRGQKLATNALALITQLPTEEGDSGGALFDSRGEVAGMVSAQRRQSSLAAVAIAAPAIRKFLGVPEPPAGKPPARHAIAEKLHRATVWIRPVATDLQVVGVLLATDLVLTTGKGLAVGDRVGLVFPMRNAGGWVVDRAAYRDPLALQLRGHRGGGTILAHDSHRDLALIRLDSPVDEMQPLALAKSLPEPGEVVHTMNHPGGLEFAWVYAAGPVRQRGRLVMGSGEGAKPVSVLLCQLPAHMGSPGGAVVNDRGELVGLAAARESAQMVSYAVTADEIAAFLDVALLDRSPQTLAGCLARIEAFPARLAHAVALGLARRAEVERTAGQLAAAAQDCRGALALDAGCGLARLCRARILLMKGRTEDAAAELDAAVEKGPFNRDILLQRAELAMRERDWRRARGDLVRILDVNPADAEARLALADAHLGLGDDTKAAAAVADTLRADPKRLPAVGARLLAQADQLARKYPDAPSIPAEWLSTALAAMKRSEFADVLAQASAAKTDADRLAILRAGIKRVVEK